MIRIFCYSLYVFWWVSLCCLCYLFAALCALRWCTAESTLCCMYSALCVLQKFCLFQRLLCTAEYRRRTVEFRVHNTVQRGPEIKYCVVSLFTYYNITYRGSDCKNSTRNDALLPLIPVHYYVSELYILQYLLFLFCNIYN